MRAVLYYLCFSECVFRRKQWQEVWYVRRQRIGARWRRIGATTSLQRKTRNG